MLLHVTTGNTFSGHPGTLLIAEDHVLLDIPMAQEGFQNPVIQRQKMLQWPPPRLHMNPQEGPRVCTDAARGNLEQRGFHQRSGASQMSPPTRLPFPSAPLQPKPRGADNEDLHPASTVGWWRKGASSQPRSPSLPGAYLQRDHLHQDSKVGEVRAAADGIAEVPFRERTALVRPDAFSGAETQKERSAGSNCPALPQGLRNCSHSSGWWLSWVLLIRPQGNKYLFPSGRGKLCTHVDTITLENIWSDIQ